MAPIPGSCAAGRPPPFSSHTTAARVGFDWGGPTPISQALHELFSAGLVRFMWEQSGGPARRVYEPTETGTTSLADYVRSAAEEATLVCTLIANAQRTTPTTPAQPIGDGTYLAGTA